MKNSGFLKTTTLMLGLAITIASCTKENNPVPNPGPVGNDKVLGHIYDYGPPGSGLKGEQGELRVMQTSFTNVGEVRDVATNDVRFVGLEVNLTLVVDEDNMIPAGGYVFYSGDVPQSFTLIAGTSTIADPGESGTQFTYSVTGGSVSVGYNGSDYSFIFDLTLEDGEVLRGSAEGTMTYEDVHP
jgi:hypothetical protein